MTCRLPTLATLVAGGLSFAGCATEADAPPVVTVAPVHTAGAEAVVSPVPVAPPVVLPLDPPEVVPLGGAPMPVTALPVLPPAPPTHRHPPVRLIAR